MSAQLDNEEAQIKAGTHPELLAELKAIEARRESRINALKAQRDYFHRMWEKNFQAVCKAAEDQYHVCLIIESDSNGADKDSFLNIPSF